MTVSRIPLPPGSIGKDSPDLLRFLMKLVSDLQNKLDQLNDGTQQLGIPFRLPLIARADIVGGQLLIRPPDYPVMAYCPDIEQDPSNPQPALVITDGTVVRTINLGPGVT